MIPENINKGLFQGLGNYLYKYPPKRFTIENPMEGVELDYYFMAKRFAGSKTEVAISLWTVVVDNEGFVYGMYTHQIGHYYYWKELIEIRIKTHLVKLGVDSLQIKRTLRDIIIEKEGHIIPYDARHCGDRIGIDGSDELYVRKSRFTFIK